MKARWNPWSVVSCRIVSSSRARTSFRFCLCAAFNARLLDGGVGGCKDNCGGEDVGVKESITLDALSEGKTV